VNGGRPSPLSVNAVRYAWEELLARAGISTPETCPLRLRYGAMEFGGDSVQATVDVRCADEHAWTALLHAIRGELPEVELADLFPDHRGALHGRRPVLFAPPDAVLDEPVRLRGDTLTFEIDVIATTVFMLSRWEETVSTVMDAHERFPSNASVAVTHGFLDHPIVDEVAMALRSWIQVLAHSTELRPLRMTVALSHDVDRLRSVRGLRGSVRRLVGDVVRRRSLAALSASALQLRREWRDQTSAPAWAGVLDLARRSRSVGLSGTFFFIAAPQSDADGDYSVDSPTVTELVRQLAAAGFEIGLHGGYHTQCDGVELARQRRTLANVIPVRISRQHYLRFRTPDTWRALVEAGIEIDTTVGYADQEGFRAGTCHAFRVFDIERDEVLPLVELPLIVMDVTLRSYRELSPAAAVSRTLELAERCARVGGTFSLLWHNTSIGNQWPGWDDAYDRILAGLSLIQRGDG